MPPSSSTSLAGLRAIGALTRMCLPLRFAPSSSSHLLHHRHAGPLAASSSPQCRPSPTALPPFPAAPDHLCRPTLCLEMLTGLNHPALISPFSTPSLPRLTIIGIKDIILPVAASPQRSPDPYKRQAPLSATTAALPLTSSSLSPSFTHATSSSYHRSSPPPHRLSAATLALMNPSPTSHRPLRPP
jgi:hypothetical protein